MITKRICCGLIIATAMFSSAALTHEAKAAAGQQNVPQKNAIVGSWVETITLSGPGAPPPFKAVGLYTQDGSLIFSDQASVTTNPPQVFSSGLGAWTHLSGRTFAWTVAELISDLNGNLVGTLKVRGESTLNETGERYTSRFRAEIFDTNGNIVFVADGTNVGQRIVVEPLP